MPITHEWNGTILTITSDSGTSSADLRGGVGNMGARGPRGLTGRAGGGAAIEDGIISTDSTWSSAGIMDRFAEAMTVEGNPVQLNALPNLPLTITSTIEPYQHGEGTPTSSNIRSIDNYDSLSIVRCGKNLIQTKTTTQTISGITYTVNTDGSISVSGTATATSILQYPLFILAKGKYKLTGCPVGGSQNNYSLRCLDDYSNILGDDIGSGATLTLDTNKQVIVAILIRSGITVNTTFYPMIQLAENIDTTYELYKGNTFTIVLDSPICCGEIDWNRGEIVVDKGYLYLDGSADEEYGIETSPNAPFGFVFNTNITDACDNNRRLEGTSNQAKCVLNIFDNYSANTFGITIGGQKMRFVIDSTITTVEQLRTYLNSKPMQVCYPLAAPKIIKFETQTINAISGQNTLLTNAGKMIVYGRVDTMYQLYLLEQRIAALEAREG